MPNQFGLTIRAKIDFFANICFIGGCDNAIFKKYCKNQKIAFQA